MALQRELSFKLPLMRGDDVREVQQALIRAGIVLRSNDGVFGPATRDAVIEFQQKLRAQNPAIDVDGIVGRDTWSALFPEKAAVEVVNIQVGEAPASLSVLDKWPADLAPYAERLSAEHGPPVGAGTVRWKLTAGGIVLAGESKPRRTKGDPVTATRTWQAFKMPIEKCAAAYGVPVELIIATACTESGGNPAAAREEPGFVNDDTTPNRVSLGLMQTLISTARDTLNDSRCGRADLLKPETSIRAGTAYIRRQATRATLPTNFDPPLVGIAYNAGSLRPTTGNAWGLIQTDRGGGHVHADAFIEYFNDAFAVFEAAASDDQRPNANAPSFWSLLNRNDPKDMVMQAASLAQDTMARFQTMARVLPPATARQI